MSPGGTQSRLLGRLRPGRGAGHSRRPGGLDFDQAFTVFHSIFFPGKDNWLFDPATDPVILILPEEFFRSCAILILAAVLLCCAALIIADLCRRRRPHKWAQKSALRRILSVKKASQSLPPAGGKASLIRFCGGVYVAKTLLSLQVWNLFAHGEQIMRAADCKAFVQKRASPFWTVSTPCGASFRKTLFL